MKWKFWEKEKKFPFGVVKPEPVVEDITQVRNLHEKIAGIKLGNAFGLTTREGIMIFRYVELRTHPKKEGNK